MIKSEIGDLSRILVDLGGQKARCKELRGQMDVPDVEELGETLGDLEKLCVQGGFGNAFGTVQTAQGWLGDEDCTYEAGHSEITHVIEALRSEFYERRFFQLSRDRAKYWNQTKPFGDLVDASFPSARSDIEGAANCLAIERDTAAVFHLMRTVEWGLLALCAEVGLKQARVKKQVIPLNWAEWGNLLGQINDAREARQNKKGRL